MIKNKKYKVSFLAFSMVLILLIIGVSYAFFSFYKTGLYTHTINGGKLDVLYNETTGNNILIENAYPRTDVEALEYGLEFEFTITGYNESEKTAYYAIEIEHGADVENKTRLKDTDMKLTLYENEEIVIENEIFGNLNKQKIYYSTIDYGTSKDNKDINNYKLRIWINDNVFVHNAIDNDIALWDDYDYKWANNNLDYDELARINNNQVNTLSELGISIYDPLVFEQCYASFKINVLANLDPSNVGYITYDANGGTFDVEKTSLLTNMVTNRKPVMEDKGFLGWSSDPLDIVPEYLAGDKYYGAAKTLYAIYGDIRNVMDTFPSVITNQKANITEVYFKNLDQNIIDARYESATIKADLTYNNQGKVLGWLEDDPNNSGKYILYVASDGVTYLNTGYRLFYYFTNLVNIDLLNVDSSMVTTMQETFCDCTNLPMLDVSMLNTSNVLEFAATFAHFDVLTNLDLSYFDTSNATNMSSMFSKNKKLETINLSSFDTSKVETMVSMFVGCESLKELDVSNFRTPNLTDVGDYIDQGNYYYATTSPFGDCKSLTTLDLSSWDFSNVTCMSGLFMQCNKIESITFGKNFDMSNVETIAFMFAGCLALKTVDFENFNTSKVTNMLGVFAMSGFEELDLTMFDTSNVTNMMGLFNNCHTLKTLNVSNWNTSNVNDMNMMFTWCDKLESLDLNSWNTEKVTDMSQMFGECQALTTLDLSSFLTPQVTNMTYMFYGCSKLVTLDLSSFDTSKVTDMTYMFESCTALTSLDISNFTFDTTILTSYARIFASVSTTVRVLVKSDVEQSWILALVGTNRPSEWTTENVVVKNS